MEVSDSLVPVVSRIIADVKRMFDTGCDPAEISSKLMDLEKYCGGGFRAGTRLPGAADSFEICVRAVLGQQITVKAARTLAERLVKNFGRPVDTGREGLESRLSICTGYMRPRRQDRGSPSAAGDNIIQSGGNTKHRRDVCGRHDKLGERPAGGYHGEFDGDPRDAHGLRSISS